MIIVWGGIAFQIVGGLSDDDEVLIVSDPILKPLESSADTINYELTLNYDDPFQVSRRAKSSLRKNTKATLVSTSRIRSNKQNNKPKSVITWPNVKYNGLVKSSNSKVVGLFSIGSSSFLAKKGETYKDIEVLEFSEAQITLKYQGEEKIISK